MRSGRPVKTYTASYDTTIKIPGLSRQPDGRWRVLLPDGEKRFAESDERLAVQRAKRLLGLDKPAALTDITVTLADLLPVDPPNAVDEINYAHADRLTRIFDAAPGLCDDGSFPEGEMQEAEFKLPVPDALLYPWLAKMLRDQPEFLAYRTGDHRLMALRSMPGAPPARVKLATVLETYRKENPAAKNGNDRAAQIFEQMMDFTGAKALEDLDHERLGKWRDSIEKSPTITSAQTKRWMYGQIRAVLSFNLKCPGSDVLALRAALDRAKVLWTADDPPPVQPKPIKVEHYHALLKAAGTGSWRAWLLLGLNAAMYIEEICDLKWGDVDLDRGTLAMIRKKTRRKRIPRAATLWPETVAAIKTLHRGPVYVFTSPRGTRYASSQSRCNAFADLRARAGVPDDVGFSQLKDAAYTVACNSATDERLARVLAGHRADGLQDNYVLRHPEIVRPACDAVYKAYAPLPPLT